LLSYRNIDLEAVVRKVTEGRKIRSRLKASATWKDLAQWVHRYLPFEQEKAEWVQQGFGTLWSRFAGEFLDEGMQQEYNAIKHGLRPTPGGFSLRYGIGSTPGQVPPPESMRSLGGSEYGSSYHVREKIGPKMLNFRPRSYSRNWHPGNLVSGLGLISMSLNNVVCFLRIINGEKPEECRFEHPSKPDDFDTPWAQSVGTTSTNMDTIIREEDVTLYTKEDVYASYDSPR